LPATGPFANHYERSKCEAEAILQNEYGDLPWHIYRVATVLAHNDPLAEVGEHFHGATAMALHAVQTAPFWLMLAAFFFGNVCSQTLHVHQVAYLVDQGVAAIAAASVVGVVGLSSIIGKTGGGWLSDRVEREKVYVAGIAVMLCGVAVLASLGPAPATGAIYLYGALLGLGYSVTASLIPAMVSDRFGGPQFGTIVGVGLLGSAVGSAVGPWMAGFLFDRTGSYALGFSLAAGSGLVAGAAGWQARALRLRAARSA